MKWRIFANRRGDNIDNGPALEPGVAPTSPARKGPTIATEGTTLTGTLRDVDDEWALFEVEQKKGGAHLTAIRLDSIESFEEK